MFVHILLFSEQTFKLALNLCKLHTSVKSRQILLCDLFYKLSLVIHDNVDGEIIFNDNNDVPRKT